VLSLQKEQAQGSEYFSKPEEKASRFQSSINQTNNQR
jgi:hypothetical protein